MPTPGIREKAFPNKSAIISPIAKPMLPAITSLIGILLRFFSTNALKLLSLRTKNGDINQPATPPKIAPETMQIKFASVSSKIPVSALNNSSVINVAKSGLANFKSAPPKIANVKAIKNLTTLFNIKFTSVHNLQHNNIVI